MDPFHKVEGFELPDPPEHWLFNNLLLVVSAQIPMEELREIMPKLDFVPEPVNDDCSTQYFLFFYFDELREKGSSKKQELALVQILRKLDRPDLIVLGKMCFPDQRKLDSMWSKPGKKKIAIEECEKVCELIKSISQSILHVWPAYDSDAIDEIVFVVLTQNTPETSIPKSRLDELGYSLYIKCIDTFSEESKQVTQSKENIETRLTYSQVEDIERAINNHADNLMQNHKYLSAISGSGVRSKYFREGKEGHCISPEQCIVLYVHTKGKIHLREDRFPNDLDGIPVDVREGKFETTTLTPSDYHQPLRMGCQISSDNTGEYGTLGGFFDHPELGLCGITCAHLVLKEHELHEQRGEKKIWCKQTHFVYQPDNSSEQYCVGPVKETVIKSGSPNSSGIDMAVFKIKERAPDSGHFAIDTDVRYETGRTLGTTGLQSTSEVTKFGRTTGETKGYLEFQNTVVRKIAFDRKYKYLDNEYTFLLKGQLEIRPHFHPRSTFSDGGDSGAFVFTKDATDQLVCIGMIVGKLESNGNAIVTPISVIKEELGISKLYDFSWNYINKRLQAIDEKLDTIMNRLDSTSNTQTGQ